MTNAEGAPAAPRETPPNYGHEWDSFADLEAKREELNPVVATEEEASAIDVEELKSSYPQNEGESDEDYEKRIASMKEMAENGSSKLESADKKEKENREAANKVEALIKKREEKAAKMLEMNTEKISKMLDVDKDNADLQATVEKRKKESEAEIENLRKRLDTAIANGTTAELLEELELDDRIDEEFDKSQEDTGWTTNDALKVKDVDEKYADRFKTVLGKIKKLDDEIKKLEDKIGDVDNPEEAAKDHAEEQKKRAKELTNRYLEMIDGNDNLDAVAKQNQKNNAKAHHDRIIGKIEKELQERISKIDDNLAELNERKSEKNKLKDALSNMNNNMKKEKTAIRREFERSISRPEDDWSDEEREAMNKLRMENPEEYEVKLQEAKDERIKNPELFKKDKKRYWEDQKKHYSFFKQHEAENIGQLKANGRIEEQKSDVEVIEGISGEEKENPEMEEREEISETPEVSGKLEKLDLSGCTAENLEELEKAENTVERAIKDYEIKKKYGNVATYIADVNIEADKTPDYYVDEMNRVFRDEDLNGDAWSYAEKRLRDKYDNVKDRATEAKEGKVELEKGEDIDSGAEKFAKTVEGKMSILRQDVGEYDNGKAFVRNFNPELFVRGGDMPKVSEVMDKIVRPSFFGMGFDIAGRAKSNYDKIADKLKRKYAEYGYDEDGKKINFEVRVKNKWLARQIRKRLVFSKGEK